MAKYGLKTEAAFNSLGMRPVEILDGKEEPVRLEEVIDELRDDDEVETVLKPLVREYFDVLEDKGVVEYDDTGSLYNPGNKSLHKNGHSDEEIQRFVGSFSEEY